MSASSNHHLMSHTEQGVLVLTLTDAEIRGDDLADEISQELCAAIASLDKPRVAVDFQRVRYMNSAGLRALLTFRRHLREKEGQMLLCGLSDALTETLVATRLATTTKSPIIPFTMVPDVPAAVGQLQQ
jgi:anti-anti-sigma factor